MAYVLLTFVVGILNHHALNSNTKEPRFIIFMLSLKTAMKLLELKITPIITYGIAIIWEHLTKGNLLPSKE